MRCSLSAYLCHVLCLRWRRKSAGQEVPVAWESCSCGTGVQVCRWTSPLRTCRREERDKGPRQTVKGSGARFSVGLSKGFSEAVTPAGREGAGLGRGGAEQPSGEGSTARLWKARHPLSRCSSPMWQERGECGERGGSYMQPEFPGHPAAVAAREQSGGLQ